MQPENPRREHRSLAIATPQASATDTGIETFLARGNAIDAALAAAVSLTVSYPNNCALGGDLIALARRADGAVRVINASGPAPSAVDLDALRSRSRTMPVYGPLSVTVPGLLGGLHDLWRFGGTRPWATAFETAVAQAEEGVPVTPSLAAAIEHDAPMLARDHGMRSVFIDADGPLRAGATLRQRALGTTLRAIASEGPGAMYGGDVGASVVATLQALGSSMTRDDLAAFAPETREPLDVNVGRHTISTAPPNSQGFLLPLILRAAELHVPALDPLGANAGGLATAFQLALDDREAHLADPRFHTAPLDDLLDVERLERRVASHLHPRSVWGTGDTVAVVTADDAGNCVSLIQSVFHAFGSGILDAATGVILHNRGAYFSLDPASPNVVAGGKRPAHTLMPCLALEGAAPRVVTGTMGGSAQPQILAEVLLRLQAGDDALAAVGAPRWVVGGLEAGSTRDQILIEPGVPDQARRALAGTGLPLVELQEHDENVGHAQLITLGSDGALVAASDPRSEGAGRVVNAPIDQ